MSFDPRYHVLVDDGKFFAPGSREHLEGMFKLIGETPESRPLVVHFHGGLVDEAGGFDVATKLQPIYEAAGAYPVFFIWRAGLWEVLGNNLGNIWKERTFQRLLVQLLRFTWGKLRPDAHLRGPKDELNLPGELDIDDLLEQWDTDKPFEDFVPVREGVDESLTATEEEQLNKVLRADTILQQELVAQAKIAAERGGTRSTAMPAGPPAPTMMQPEILEGIREAGRKAARGRGTRSLTDWLDPGPLLKAGVIMGKILWRMARGRHHGVYATVVEELLRVIYIDAAGKFVWKQMKGDTEDSFKSGNDRVGRAFVELLKKELKARPKRRVILVGHSTGAVYICEFLKHVSKEKLPKTVQFEVAFLAAACTFELLAKTIDDHGDRIAQIRSFAMSDEREKADYLLPDAWLNQHPWAKPAKKIYPHSLLYLVSGIFEKDTDMPLVGMQRFHSGKGPFDPEKKKNKSIKIVREFLTTDGRTCWAIENQYDGRRTEAGDHGEFDEDSLTRESLKHIIERGWV